MSAFRLLVNGQEHLLEDVVPSAPLLWVLRDRLGLVGTKYGCGIGNCGACTVHIDGTPVRACSVPAEAVADQPITTIEGLAGTDGTLHPLQEAWIEHDVPQCGYCQAGQIMSAAALLMNNSSPSEDELDEAMTGNICRCGTYIRIRRAILDAAERINERAGKESGA